MVDANRQPNIQETRNTATELLLYLAVAALVFAVISILLVNNTVHNIYDASYFTTSAIFDAIGFDQGTTFTALASQPGSGFYTIIGVSVLDGIIKMVIVGFVVAGLIDMITSLDIRSRIYGLANKKMKNHFVICGYSGLTDRMIKEFTTKGEKFLVIENEQALIDTLREAGVPCLKESYTTSEGLMMASIQDAKAILFLGDNDYENMLGVITARSLNSKVRIVARAENSDTPPRLHSAGADLCVIPEVLSGLEIGEAVANAVSK
jgi:voltage-gated potassium channel